MADGSDLPRPQVTLAICTCNRADSLRRTLASLASQTGVDFLTVEVLVVDNNSTDDTPAVIDAFAGSLPVRRVFERRQGLSHARNRAVEEFQGAVLLFTDDDVRLAPGWLAAYRDAFARYPQAEYFGGRIVPDWQGNRPEWVREPCLHLIDGVLVWFDHGSETRLFSKDEATPFGASFAITRPLLDRIGTFRVDLGTGGAGSGRGEETEFLRRARAAGAVGAYVGSALCFHEVDPRRLTLPALYRHGKASGRSHSAMAEGDPRGTSWSAALFLLRGIAQLLRGRGDRFRQCVINAGIQMGARRSGNPVGAAGRSG